MANQIGLSGGQPQKNVRFSPIYTGRWSSGLWTNRSPLRDGNTSRQSEKYYGPAGDAIIDGSNVEITNRLTLARRPGNLIYDASGYNAVSSFQPFRMFSPTDEQINVMIDEANQLSSLNNGVKSQVWSKSSGAGQSFMQSVGNTLYFGNGVDNKKWLQSLVSWSVSTQWNGPTSPYFTTFLIDSNGNIQQLTGCIIGITNSNVTAGILTVTASTSLQPGGSASDIVAPGMEVIFPSGMAATMLSGLRLTVSTVSGSTFTVSGSGLADYGTTAETGKTMNVIGGLPISDSTIPTWSVIPLTPGMANPNTDPITVDGTVQWTNRGTTTKNWGIQPPKTILTPVVGLASSAWQKNTYYSIPGVVVDSNGNIQRVTTAGKSGVTAPTWATVDGNTTTDGTVVWTQIETAAEASWVANTAYPTGHYLIANAGGVDCLFELAPLGNFAQYTGSVAWTAYAPLHENGTWYRNPGELPAPLTTTSSTGILLNATTLLGQVTPNDTADRIDSISQGGQFTSFATPFANHNHLDFIAVATLVIPAPGPYTIGLWHDDGVLMGIDGGASLVSGGTYNSQGNTLSAKMSYPLVIFGNTTPSNITPDGVFDSWIVNFPTAGSYNIELDDSHSGSHHKDTLCLTVNGQIPLPGTPVTANTVPVWPVWTTAYAPDYPSVSEAQGQMKWINRGPVTDFSWASQINFTLPNTTITDHNGNGEAPYETGHSGSVQPTFATGLNQLTNDNPSLVWINTGPQGAPAVGTVSTFSDQGWEYCIALVNTLDDTVSNATPLSTGTGPFIGATGVSLPAGDGLPPASEIDPQADYVAIFRTTDGFSVPFLIAGTGNTFYTVSLAEYLANGYTDSTPDTSLDNLIQAPIAGENTPPAGGAKNLTFHLSRIFFSVGNVVYWTSGPDTPIGNGVNGVAPLNFDEFPSLVTRIVPNGLGALVFTVSDVYIIPGTGQVNDPIQAGQPFIPGVGLLSYNALAVKGTIIGLFTTDKQLLILDPTSGVSHAGFPIGDRLRKNNASPGTTWNPKNVYLTWHAEGEDTGWYLSDGSYGWYRLIDTPAPEGGGYSWSPFASIVGGCKAVTSIEVTPGVHKLLVGPTGSSQNILSRDLDTFSDAGQSYGAWAIIGSAVLAQPGQLAEISFITTESINIGTPLVLGVLLDEARPYYTGPFELLKVWGTDPPGLPKSRSILGQRFYLSEMKNQSAACRHMQIQINWSVEAAANDLHTLTVFGTYNQEI